MRYIFDNDMHIHSHLSSCSSDPEQNTAAILQYALKNQLTTVCITDHFWDATVPGASNWYQKQDYAHIIDALPLPQHEGLRFLFGCETELKSDLTLGIARENFDKFDFVIIPTTHLHMNGFTCRGDEDAAERAELYVKRFDAVLDMDLPFRKVGIAHLTCSLIYSGHHIEVLNLISDDEFTRLFKKAAERGVGIELNFNSLSLTDETRDATLRPYRIAKSVGCKFYFGSDAHHPAGLAAEKANAENIIDLLELTEEDKFKI
ncbi:MAG: hypothetical protein HFE63_08265 [Clostridiales bacterium]|nr:hypothetical protein [Clostridiales bacterium]